MNRISLVGRLRTQKLLGRTVLILLAFSLLTVGGSYLFVRGEMVSRYREQGMEGTMSMLQRTSTSLDRTIQALELQIQTFWKDDDVSSLLVAPEKPDFSRTSGAAAQIQGLREGNELIERCWLYLYQSGQILTDRQLLLEAGDPGLPILCRGGGQPGQRKPAGALRRLAGGQTGPELPEILLRGGRAARPRSGRCGRI